MSDAGLRKAERRWRETGAVGDEAAYLLERVRVGDLKRERLVLAAYCGHKAARVALGEGAPSVPADTRSWIAGIDPSVHGVVDVAVGRLAQLLAQAAGKASRGPRVSTIRQAVRWAESEGAELDDMLLAVSQVALDGLRGLAVRGRSETS